MDLTNNPSPQRAPQRPLQPTRPRPLMNDFGPRPAHRSPAPTHAVPHSSTTPVHQARPTSRDPHPHIPSPQPEPVQPTPQQTPVPASAPERPAMPNNTPSKPRASRSHAGIIGLVLFVVLALVAFTPILPGKILEDFPGSSESQSSGDQSLACITTPEGMVVSTSYDTKLGFPIVYKYTTTTTQRALCQGKDISATGGTSSQFNPLGLVINLAAAAIIAGIVGKLWGTLYRRTHRQPAHSSSRSADSGATSGGATAS